MEKKKMFAKRNKIGLGLQRSRSRNMTQIDEEHTAGWEGIADYKTDVTDKRTTFESDLRDVCCERATTEETAITHFNEDQKSLSINETKAQSPTGSLFTPPFDHPGRNLEQSNLIILRDFDKNHASTAELSFINEDFAQKPQEPFAAPDDSFHGKIRVVIKLAIPSIICTIIFYLQQTINVYFVSHMNDKAIVSAVGLGNVIQNSFITSVMCSFNSVIETLVSQAAGSGNLEVCGTYLNRAIVVMTSAFLLSLVLIFNTEAILLNLGQDPEASRYTQQYLVYYIPALYIFGLNDLYRRFLCCFKKNTLPMLSFLISVALHPFWCYQFVIVEKHGLIGLTMAGFITNSITHVLMQIMFRFQKDIRAANSPFDRSSFQDLGTYVYIGLPNVFALVIAYFALEQMTLAAGLLSVTDQASQVILINMTMFAFMASYGMQSPGCATIGQQIGQQNIPKAKGYFYAVVLVFCHILVLEVCIFHYYKDSLISTMTTIPDLRTCIDSVYPLFLLNVVFAGLTGMLRGPIYALGLMRRLTKWNFVFQACFMPCALYYFLFKAKYGMKGIWLSKILTECGLLISYVLTITRSNWYEIAYHFMRKRVRDSKLVGPLTSSEEEEEEKAIEYAIQNQNKANALK